MDVFSAIQTIAKCVNSDEKAAFVDQTVTRMKKITGSEYPKEKRNFGGINKVKKRVEGKFNQVSSNRQVGNVRRPPYGSVSGKIGGSNEFVV